jgi:hypothetical protein
LLGINTSNKMGGKVKCLKSLEKEPKSSLSKNNKRIQQDQVIRKGKNIFMYNVVKPDSGIEWKKANNTTQAEQFQNLI